MDNKQLTNSRFGKWGWSMIIYAFLLYYFYAALCVDSMNLYPDTFAGFYGMDRNLLLGFATPAGVIGVIGGVVFGRICIKTGVRKMSAWSLIITGVLYAIFGYSSTPVMYLITLTAVSFVANAFGLIATATLMGNWFPRKKGIALGWATMGAPPLFCYRRSHSEHPVRKYRAAAVQHCCGCCRPSSGHHLVLLGDKIIRRKWVPIPTISHKAQSRQNPRWRLCGHIKAPLPSDACCGIRTCG